MEKLLQDLRYGARGFLRLEREHAAIVGPRTPAHLDAGKEAIRR